MKLPEVRHELLTTIKDKLTDLSGSPRPASGRGAGGEGVSVLDEFKSAGVFVNWWQQIRYDLKTIVSTGWHHTLIPDEYLVVEFFQAEADEIEALEAAISEAQSELAEAVETAAEVAGYEPEEGEKVTASVIKKALKELIDDLKQSCEPTALAAGRDGDTSSNAPDASAFGSRNKTDKKKITALNKDKAIINERIARTDTLLTEIGGQLTEEEARRLILKKLYDIAHAELNRYLNAEKRHLIAAVENVWDKYAVSSRQLEHVRGETLETLDGFLSGLGYVS